MKKLLALFLALSMVVFSGISAFASGIDYGTWGGAEGGEPASAFFTLSGTNSAAKHESGKEFEIVLDVTDITLQEGGIQALEFRLAYDPALVTPVTKAGEEGNFDAVISGIENWEGFGRLDETAGEYYIAFGGNETAGKIDSTVSARFTFKFTSTAAAVGSDLTFKVTDIRGVDLAGNECRPAGFEVKVADGNPKPVQPEQKEELPEGAFPLSYLGYKHDNNLSVIDYIKDSMTVGEYTARYAGAAKDMNWFYLAILDKNLVVTAVYTATGRPDGVKTDVVIPADSYVLAVNAGNEKNPDWATTVGVPFKEAVKVGAIVELYNVNIDGVIDNWNHTRVVELNQAGFTLRSFADVQPEEKEDLPEGAIKLTHAGYAHKNNVGVIGYVPEETTIGGFTANYFGAAKDMNYFYVAILDKNYKVIAIYDKIGRPDGIKTNVALAAGSYILGVHAGTAESWKNNVGNPFHKAVRVGSEITLYNVSLEGVRAQYDKAENAMLEQAGFTVYTEPVIQPDPLEVLPADAKKIDYVGYKHEAGLTVLLPAKEATTIGALVRLGDPAGIGSEAPDMNYWAVMIIDAEGKVIGIYNKLGRPDGVKTDVAVPAGGAAIGVFGNKNAFANVNIGDSVRVYNITEECFNVTGHKAVTKAGYTVTPAPAKELTPKADAKLEVIDGKVRLYVDNITLEAFKAMFDNEFTVLDSEGKEVTEGLVKTGMKIDFGEGFVITVLGDVDQNGIVNSTDYLYARRAYLGTLTLSDAQKDAADLGNDAMGNLILLKRHILGTQYIRELLTK